MSEAIASFRQLHDLLVDHDREKRPRDVLMRSVPATLCLMASLEPLRHLATSKPGEVDRDALRDLFALSVIDDLLLNWPGAHPDDRDEFFSALGFAPFEQRAAFSPLTCEIGAISNDDIPAEAGIRFLSTHWSGLMFGDMVFARCTKTVICHESLGLVAGIADESTLHFTNQRRNRPANDLSHGWGHNSRWRTDFHRSYRTAGIDFYNVDAPIDIGIPKARLAKAGSPPAELSLDQARELLMHRGFVRTPDIDEGWPYDWRLAMRDTGHAWPLNEADLVPFDVALRRAGVV